MLKRKNKIFYIAVALFWILSNIACKSHSYLNSNCPSIYDPLLKMKVFTFVDQMPKFKGGDNELFKYIAENFKYPKQSFIQSRFILEFVIDINGKLIKTSIKDKKEKDLTKAEKEIIKVFNSSPKWIPGKCKGKIVPVKIVTPLNLHY
jgi:hypothetical protein